MGIRKCCQLERMVLAYHDIMELLRVLSEDRNLRVTVTESGKGALVAGGVAGIGGLVLGPIGLAIGGSVGGCLAAYLGQGKFKPLAMVIMEDIKEEQRVQMVNAVRGIVDNLGYQQRGVEEQGGHRDGHLPQQAVQYIC